MTLQDKIIDASAAILSQPQVEGKVRQYGIKLDHELTQVEILTITIPDGISWYTTDGRKSFSNRRGTEYWITYLLSKEDLDLLAKDSLIPGLEK